VDWQFFVDFNDPSNSMKSLSPNEVGHLDHVASTSLAVRKSGGRDLAAWEALAIALRKGLELGIPEYRLEEYSGLRGQFMLDLMSGTLDVAYLASKAVI
jgi:hypothetical protein